MGILAWVRDRVLKKFFKESIDHSNIAKLNGKLIIFH